MLKQTQTNQLSSGRKTIQERKRSSHTGVHFVFITSFYNGFIQGLCSFTSDFITSGVEPKSPGRVASSGNTNIPCMKFLVFLKNLVSLKNLYEIPGIDNINAFLT